MSAATEFFTRSSSDFQALVTAARRFLVSSAPSALPRGHAIVGGKKRVTPFTYPATIATEGTAEPDLWALYYQACGSDSVQVKTRVALARIANRNGAFN